MEPKAHWDSVYSAKGDSDLSWTQADPATSLSLIREACRAGRVIDVGGGSSVLAERLLGAGYSLAVLDISESALRRAREKMGERAAKVDWVCADVTSAPDLGAFDVWHDRAVFHFLTAPADRARYMELLRKTIAPGGHAIIATFAEDGPEKCSGLPVCRYSGAALAKELGTGLALVKTVAEQHLTPWGKPQSFQYSVFRRVA